MKNGYCFKLVFPENSKGTKQFSWKMTLRPVKYIIVDGSVQTGQDIQDFGACVYQGDRGILKLNLSFQPSGSILLICSSLCNLFILCVNAYASTVQILSCI